MIYLPRIKNNFFALKVSPKCFCQKKKNPAITSFKTSTFQNRISISIILSMLHSLKSKKMLYHSFLNGCLQTRCTEPENNNYLWSMALEVHNILRITRNNYYYFKLAGTNISTALLLLFILQFLK